MRKIIDLSIYFENGTLADPPVYEPKIMYRSPKETADEILPFFPGLKKEDLPDGEGWAIEWAQAARLPMRLASSSPLAQGRGSKQTPAVSIAPSSPIAPNGGKIENSSFASGSQSPQKNRTTNDPL